MSECLLPAPHQQRNVWLYAFNVAMAYFAAPVMYVGVLQSALCKSLETNDFVANLSGSAYLLACPFPVLVALMFPQVRALQRLLLAGYLAEATISFVFLLTLYSGSRPLILTMLVVHAAVLGCANGVVGTCLWEILGRGVSDKRRGMAFLLAFGVGPAFAVVGSLSAQLILSSRLSLDLRPYGNLLEWKIPQLSFPHNYAVIFGACIPMMLLAAYTSSRFVIPLTPEEQAEPIRWRAPAGNFRLQDFFGSPIILAAAIAYLLVYAAEQIQPNMSSYIRYALHSPPEKYTGLCLAMRFGCKIFAGFALGWMAMRFPQKLTLYVTALLCLCGILWAQSVDAELYLFSFGLIGAGELFGNYYPNYILSCSQPDQMRSNMAYTSMLTAVAGFGGLIYGAVSDRWGLPASFHVANAFAILAILIVTFLPWRAKPADPADELQKSFNADEPAAQVPAPRPAAADEAGV